MIYLNFILFTIAMFYLILIVKYRKIYKRDKALFKMASLRGEVMQYMIKKFDKLSKKDAEACLELVEFASYTISNHKNFYNSLKYKDFSSSLKRNKEVVVEAEEQLNLTHNKTIKGFYVDFALIILKNITLHSFIFRTRLTIKLINVLTKIVIKKTWISALEKLIQFLDWFQSKTIQFETDNRRLHGMKT